MSRKAVKDKALPKGWRRVKVIDFSPLQRGFDLPTDQIKEGAYPVVYSNGIKNYHSEYKLKAPGVVTGRSGTIGEVTYVIQDYWPHNTSLWVTDFKENQPKFAFYSLQNLRLDRFYAGSGVPTLNRNDVHKQSILVPPLSQQKAITSLLETWDTAIEKTERLIAAKGKQFKWLLKRLISDQRNNPEWRKVKLNDVGLVSSAGVDKKTVEGENSVRLVNYLDVLRKDFISSDDLDHWVTAPDRKVIQCDVRKGDVFFTPSSEIQGDIAHSAVAVEDIDKAVYSYHIVRFRLNENWDTVFRTYAFKSSHFYKQAYRMCEGSGQRYVISQDDFRNMTICIPNLEEQRKIAQTLSTAQKEIDLLRQFAKRYRTQKRGLMQKLLTGEWQIKT